MWSSFSFENASDVTMSSGWPFTAQTSDSETPVLPPVYSTTAPSGGRRPSASAAAIIANAMRSFMLPVGFSLSTFNRMRDPFAGTMCRRAIMEVLPMRSRIVMMRTIAAGLHRRQWQDRHI